MQIWDYRRYFIFLVAASAHSPARCYSSTTSPIISKFGTSNTLICPSPFDICHTKSLLFLRYFGRRVNIHDYLSSACFHGRHYLNTSTGTLPLCSRGRTLQGSRYSTAHNASNMRDFLWLKASCSSVDAFQSFFYGSSLKPLHHHRCVEPLNSSFKHPVLECKPMVEVGWVMGAIADNMIAFMWTLLYWNSETT